MKEREGLVGIERSLRVHLIGVAVKVLDVVNHRDNFWVTTALLN